MSLPFSVDRFLGVFAAYNRAVWPAQALLYGVAVVLVAAALPRVPWGQRPVGVGLALLWAWMGVVYHAMFFARINPAARVFGFFFCLQAVLFLVWAVRAGPVAVPRIHGLRAWLGGVLIAYGMVIYPIVSWAVGHRYPFAPTFGVPCPTTITTLGLLVWMVPPAPRWLTIIPLAWCLLGVSAEISLGMKEDIGLTAAAIISAVWFASTWWRSHSAFKAGSSHHPQFLA